MVSALNYIAPNNKDLLITELSSISYSFYDWMRRLYPKSLVSILAYIALSPLLFVFALIIFVLLGVGHLAMIYLNFRLKKMLFNDIVLTNKNYKNARLSKEVLENMLHHLDNVTNHTDHDVFFIMPYVNQAKDTKNHLLSYISKIELALNNLDNISYPSNEFTHITQEALWTNRSKVYKYIV